jgi:predicted aspartyl protease
MTNFKALACIVLAFMLVPALRAETHCPGDVESVPLHFVNGYQIIVSVSVNDSGPFDFLLDTGAQFTMIDPSLAAELHLNPNGSVPVTGNGFRTISSAVELDRVKVGRHAVANLEALEFDVHNIRPQYPRLRGVLGEDFLQQFDVLIDNLHRLLCLDDSAGLRTALKGPRIALQTASDSQRVPRNSLIVAVRLSNSTQTTRLKLDSGANAPVLYSVAQFKPIDLVNLGGSLRGSGANGSQVSYLALLPQDVRIGRVRLSDVSFFAPTKDISNTTAFDGLLPLRLFQRVFISHAEHFVILETP